MSGQNRKSSKRKPNIGLIKTSRCYSVSEVAECLGRSEHTVRGWIRQGLPVLPGVKPRLIDGVELKSWLRSKWQSRKRPCRLEELFCCKCRKPRRPAPRSVKTEAAPSPEAVRVRGDCQICGTPMQQVRKLSQMPQMLSAMGVVAQEVPNLSGCREPSVIDTFLNTQVEENTMESEGGSKSVH